MLPLAHGGFGINTNIFETNLINLAVVIGIVIFFVGGNLTALLDDRKKTILSNLEQANLRAVEAQEKLQNAKAQLELSKKKAKEIREEGISRVASEIKTIISQHEIRLAGLNDFKKETIQFYQQKSFKEAYIYVISRIVNRVIERLNKGLNSTSHVIVNNFYVSKFTDYKSKPTV
jgi:F-type H+-transporting ATPase subunit b